jgi:SAM-dependent methyltransferase
MTSWLFERLDLRSDELVLDVAAGTGRVARALAPAARAVVAIDATRTTLAIGHTGADEAGLDNVIFQLGDAAALPFLDSSFDVVVSRFAVHHFEEPSLQVAEMIRCLRPGGRLALADIVADPDPAVARSQNRLEQLRDPSHTWMFSLDGLRSLLDELEVVSIHCRDVERPLEPWLAHAKPSVEVVAAIRAELQAELHGGERTGFRPRESGGELMFVQTYASIIARKSRSAPSPVA